jgi:hypothetical protein
MVERRNEKGNEGRSEEMRARLERRLMELKAEEERMVAEIRLKMARGQYGVGCRDRYWGSSLHYTEDKTYTPERTTGMAGESKLKNGEDDREIARVLAHIMRKTGKKLEQNPQKWKERLLKMRQEIGDFLDAEVEE